MPNRASLVRDIVSCYAETAADNRVFFHPDIPPERLAEALSGYPGVAGSEVLVLLDNTDTGSATEGAVLTAVAVHARAGSGPPRTVGIPELRSVVLEEGGMRRLLINGEPLVCGLRVRPETMARVADMLLSLARACGRAAGPLRQAGSADRREGTVQRT